MAEQPTEPAAFTAAGLLAAGEVDAQGGQARTSAWAGHAQLARLVQRATADRDVGAVLDQLTARPQDPAAIGALAQVLAAIATQDPGFRKALARLVDQAEHDHVIGGLATTIAGHAQVGKLVTIGQAGAVHVHLPPPPPQTLLDLLHRATTGGPLVANLPPRNPAFTGRVELLDQLHASLRPGQTAAVVQVRAQAVHGLGGVGKTQLALKYAHRHQGDYDLLWWVTADPAAAIPGQLVALARRLGVPEATQQAETVQVLWDELRGRNRWLLVYDNAEDPADLRPWWPPDSGRVLVTSRNPAWAGLAAAIPLDVLPRREATAFLRRRLGRDDPAFEALATALGDLPLGLEQAAAYLDETATGVADYLDLLRDRAQELFALGRLATTEQTIATTWTVSLQRLRDQAPAAEDLLCLCAFLAADDIPRDLPTEHSDLLPKRLATAVGDPLAYQQNTAALRRYSLIKTSQDGQTLSVHRLVQQVVRDRLGLDRRRQLVAAALRLLQAAFPDAYTDPHAWPVYAQLLPHVLAATGHAEALDTGLERIAWLLSDAGLYLWQRADHLQARALLERALAIHEVHLGAAHPATAWSLNTLASVLHAQGDLQGARMLHERALAIREASRGHDHPATAQSLNNLALVLHAQGDLQGARSLHERALAIRETRFGPDHPETAQGLHGLAAVLRDQGDLEGARTLYERALHIREARLDAGHPDTVASRQDLAAVVTALDEQE
jgi:tetratricopeptide (TPR) repeat protein